MSRHLLTRLTTVDVRGFEPPCHQTSLSTSYQEEGIHIVIYCKCNTQVIQMKYSHGYQNSNLDFRDWKPMCSPLHYIRIVYYAVGLGFEPRFMSPRSGRGVLPITPSDIGCPVRIQT